MRMQYKQGWVLLTSFAGCAALATAAFAVEPHALMRLAHAHDVQQTRELQPGENVQRVYLIKLLEGSSQFRVRAQAAISLGMMGKSPAARDALTAALQDAHPAVRAAAATSLGRIGDANHVVALRKLGGDPEEPVRNAAGASVRRLESMLEAPPVATVATNAELTATIGANRM